jgi:acyl-CoA synthetase (AMP-forming)/AMP-acid ligase II
LGVYAAMKLGAIVVPIDPRSAPPELANLLDDSGALILAFDATVAGVVGDSASETSTVELLAFGPVDGVTNLAELSEDESSSPFVGEVKESDDALILYTLGTTGRPEGALFDHHRTIWVGVSLTSLCGLTYGDRLLHVAPLYYAAEHRTRRDPLAWSRPRAIHGPRCHPEADEQGEVVTWFDHVTDSEYDAH